MDTSDPITHPCRMSHKEKEAFKEFLIKYLRDFGLNEGRDSFIEALKGITKALMPTTIPQEVRDIMDDPKTSNPGDSKFWIMCAALREFVRVHASLPVRGVLPDMTAGSDKYIKLQKIYRDKAEKDTLDVFGRCQPQGEGSNIVFDEGFRRFCKESYHLRLIRGTPFYQELENSPTNILNDLAQNMEEFNEDPMYYIMLRGVLKFHSEYNVYPGALDEHEPDIARFKDVMSKTLNQWNSPLTTVRDDFVHEMCRNGGSEIPSVAAFIGGCVAHEAIKIITSQYVPLNNTMVYNGNRCTTSSWFLR